MPKDDLSGRKLDHVTLLGANLADSDLSKSSLRRSHFVGASSRNANLAESDLQNAHLDHADLAGAVLRNADLRGTDPARAATTEGPHSRVPRACPRRGQGKLRTTRS